MSKSCVLARHGISVGVDGSLMPCCQFKSRIKSHTFRDYPQWRIKMDQLAADLDNGIDDSRCQQCWHDEALGYNSLRTASNKRHQEAEQLNKNKQPALSDPWHVEFKLGNFCNLRCIMCSPESSSSIWSEYSQNEDTYRSVGIAWNPPGGEHRWWETEAFAEFCSNTLPTVRYLHFSGGEPFMVPGLGHILNQVSDPSVVDLLFVTNMTMINDTVLELIKQFKSVNFAISLEGTGQHNDYVRGGSDFATIEQNLDRVRNIIPTQTQMIVNHTFQHTSIYSLPRLIEWCNTQNLDIHFSLHGGFNYMKINSVPPEDMEKFKTQIDQLAMQPSVKSYIDQVVNRYMYMPDLNTQFRRYTDMLDSVRGTNFDATFAPATRSV
jgi:sulfatase maturation enzyme AslB (radical SAM superfamily)